MADMVLEDDVFVPRGKVEVKYKGPDPFSFYKKLNSSYFQKRLEIGGTDFWERDFRWDITTDPRKFYVRIFLHKGFDKNTEVIYEITFQGEQPTDPKKDGKLTITFSGKLKSSFPMKTSFQQTFFYKAILWLYNRLFYFRVRRKYLELAQRKMYEIINEVREWAGAMR